MSMLAEQLRNIIEGPLGTEPVAEDTVTERVKMVEQNERRHVFGVVICRDGDDKFYLDDRSTMMSRREAVEAVKERLAERGRLISEKLDFGAMLAMGDQQKAVDAAEKKIGEAFKKVGKRYVAALDKLTGAKWRVVSASESIFSLDSDESPKRAIDIYWEYDPGSQTSSIYVEGPKSKQKVYNRQKMTDIPRRNYIDWLSNVLKEDMDEIIAMALNEDEDDGELAEGLGRQLSALDIVIQNSRRGKSTTIGKGINQVTRDEATWMIRQRLGQWVENPQGKKAVSVDAHSSRVMNFRNDLENQAYEESTEDDQGSIVEEIRAIEGGGQGSLLEEIRGIVDEDSRALIEKKFSDFVGKNTWATLLPAVMRDKGLQQELFDLIQTAYKPIGGHLKIKKPADIPKEIHFAHAVDVDEDPEADAIVFGKIRAGRPKLTGLGQDGSSAGKKKSMDKWGKELKAGKAFAEVSGAIAHITLNKLGAKSIGGEEVVKKMLPGKSIEWVGKHPSGKYPGNDNWYKRKIGAKSELKIMVGKGSPGEMEKMPKKPKREDTEPPQDALVEEIWGIVDEAAMVSYRRRVAKAPPYIGSGKVEKPKKVPSGTKVSILFKRLVKALTRGGDWDIEIKALRKEGVPESHINYAIKHKEVPYAYAESIEDDGTPPA